MDTPKGSVKSIIDDTEPQITSTDPNERKLARKLRIDRRLEAIRKQYMPEGEEVVVEEKTLFQQQAEKSMEVLEKLIIEGDELVSNVRVANDAREVDRREDEGVNKEKILEKLHEEADDAKEKFDEITRRWLEILQYNDPLAISDEISNQKEKCDALVKQKDGIICMLKDELKQSDIKFTKDQRKQKEDINTLTQRIEKQLVVMRHAYREQLQLQEEATMIERKILMEGNNKKWDDLFKKRSQKEEENCKRKFEQLDEFVEAVRKLRVDFQEKYREARIKLENDIENLQCELEHVKTVCMLNSEKLDYNYQILKKREDENIIIKSQQKRRLNKLQDVINDLRSKIRNYEDSSNLEIAKLTEQIKKLHTDIMKIEEKADHFMEANDTKFHQVWDLNKATADKLLDDILKVDKVIHEQQLGLKWDPPDISLKDKMDMPSYRMAHDAIAEAERKTNPKGKSVSSLTQSGSEESKRLEDSPTLRKLMRKILKQVSDKTGFFLEERLQEVLKPYSENDKTLVRLDNVFSALQLRDRNDIRILMDYFLPYTHCPICSKVVAAKESEEQNNVHEKVFQATSTASRQSFDAMVLTDVTDIMGAAQQPEEVVDDVIDCVVDADSVEDYGYRGTSLTLTSRSEGSEEELGEERELQRADSTFSGGQSAPDSTKDRAFCERNHPLVISSVYILRALKEFVSSIHKPKKGPPTMSKRLSNRRDTISRLLSLSDIEAYWSRYLEVFSPMRLRTWNGLYFGMQKYHAILKDRQKVNEEVMSLRRQNVELKQILESYIANRAKKGPCEKGGESAAGSPDGNSRKV